MNSFFIHLPVKYTKQNTAVNLKLQSRDIEIATFSFQAEKWTKIFSGLGRFLYN